MDKIDLSKYSKIQKDTILALLQSCENKSINFDKFILWVMKNYNPGTSIILNMIKSLS